MSELTILQKHYLKQIAKCDEFLQKISDEETKCLGGKANEVDPVLVRNTFKRYNHQLLDGGADESPNYCLVVFHANAKHCFILKLQEIQEREDYAISMA